MTPVTYFQGSRPKLTGSTPCYFIILVVTWISRYSFFTKYNLVSDVSSCGLRMLRDRFTELFQRRPWKFCTDLSTVFFEFSCAARSTNKSTNNLAYSLVVGKSHKNITFHQEGSRGWIFTKFVEGRGRLADIISCDEFRAISSRVSISQGSTHWSFPVENLYMMIAVVGVGWPIFIVETSTLTLLTDFPALIHI